MFKTCMFCNRPLGTNEVIEHFPVGRRLAFDAERGRLWVVCRKFERWNLSPLEERWEAVEMCERLFRDTRVRVSTENVGLAKHPEGLELVRIGQPMRPEFAAWRYGDQFGRRRKGALLGTLAATAVFTGIMAGASAAGIGGGGLWFLWNAWVNGRTKELSHGGALGLHLEGQGPVGIDHSWMSADDTLDRMLERGEWRATANPEDG